jgi:hypothetical protein
VGGENGDTDTLLDAGMYGCGKRRVVWDCYMVFVGAPDESELMEGEGYENPPLEERYQCTKGCAAALRPIRTLSHLENRTMWLREPHIPVKMNWFQRREQRKLIREAGLIGKGNWFTGEGDVKVKK